MCYISLQCARLVGGPLRVWRQSMSDVQNPDGPEQQEEGDEQDDEQGQEQDSQDAGQDAG